MDGPAIFVQNHKSYFDPVTALKLVKAMPVSKAEVSTWPLIGFMADYTGVLFVKREDKQSRADTLKGMEEELAKEIIFLYIQREQPLMKPKHFSLNWDLSD